MSPQPPPAQPPVASRTYTFGDSRRAIERLDLLAELFRRSTETLLDRWGVDAGVAVDLGCGPGHTTEALARTGRAGLVVGLDASPAMAATASHRLAEVPADRRGEIVWSHRQLAWERAG